MAISNRGELITKVTQWLRRPSASDLVPDFIHLCESEMQRVLNVAEQELSTTLTTTANVTTVALPAALTRIRRLRFLYNGQYVDLWPVSLAPSDVANSLTPGPPVAVSIQGSNLVVRPTPNDAYSMPLDYYAKFSALAYANDDVTNWILTNHPDAYLYGTLLHSAPYLGTDVRLPLWQEAFTSAIAGINKADFKKRFTNVQRQTEVAHLTGPNRYNIYRGY